ncbi:MAG: hypothetical protein ACI875_001282, partial [Planctomycetota bacterium]
GHGKANHRQSKCNGNRDQNGFFKHGGSPVISMARLGEEFWQGNDGFDDGPSHARESSPNYGRIFLSLHNHALG